ncbi:MAG: metallophosphoesterase [Candidatus Saccharibacteria bacterium]|nr:metallophosphoesterase [Candidatus Saccharibacteria bacterium]
MKTKLEERSNNRNKFILFGGGGLIGFLTATGLIWWLGTWGLIIILLSILWVTVIENSLVIIKKTIWRLPHAKNYVRIIQVSDFHCNGLALRNLISKLKSMKITSHDVIVLTGDTFDGEARSQKPAQVLLDFIGNLDCRSFIIWGNHETNHRETLKYARRQSRLNNIFEANQRIYFIGNNVFIAGLDYGEKVSKSLVSELDLSNYNILITHSRDQAVEAAKIGAFRAIICGHEHGGQIRLPLLGAIIGSWWEPWFPDLKGQKNQRFLAS